MTWKTKIILSLIALGVVGAGVIFYAVFFTTPRMRQQENIRNFRALMPLAPVQSVPLEEISALPDKNAVSLPGPPLAGSPEEIGKGEVYYRNYCLYCHGENGDGEGPVGRSYMPKPASLLDDRTGKMNDAELLRAMLLGTGHEPVLLRVVPRTAYPYLVLYVRILHGSATKRPLSVLPRQPQPTEPDRLAPATFTDQQLRY